MTDIHGVVLAANIEDLVSNPLCKSKEIALPVGQDSICDSV